MTESRASGLVEESCELAVVAGDVGERAGIVKCSGVNEGMAQWRVVCITLSMLLRMSDRESAACGS